MFLLRFFRVHAKLDIFDWILISSYFRWRQCSIEELSNVLHLYFQIKIVNRVILFLYTVKPRTKEPNCFQKTEYSRNSG